MSIRASGFITVCFLAGTSIGATAPPPEGIEGPFIGWYEVDGIRRDLATVWHTRQDGSRVTVAALGALDGLVFHEGSVTRHALAVEAERRGTGGMEPVSIDARIAGPFLRGEVVTASGRGRLVLRRATGSIVERGLVAAETDAAGTPVRAIEIAAAVGSGGELVAGRYRSFEDDDCSVLGCAGDVVALAEDGAVLTMRLRSDDACPVVTDVVVTFDMSTYLYSGTFTASGCGGATSGTLLAARTFGTQNEHASQMLTALGRLADDLEGDAPLARPHPSFMPDYIYSGRSLDDLLDGYEAERSVYSPRRVTFDRVRSIRTIVDPLILPGLEIPPLGLEFDERREGDPLAGGPNEVYADSRTRPGPPRLGLWAEGSTGWVIAGNGFAGIDLPFEYTAGAHGTLEVPTPGGTVWVSVGPYGTHSGHVNGDAKTNFVGFFSDGYTEMVDLGDGDGVREPGEPWGFYGGLDGALLRNRIPTYIAPADAELYAIVYEAFPGSFYFEGMGQWGVELSFADGTRLHLGHLGRVAPALRERVLDELGIDVWAYAGPPAVVVPPGSGIRVFIGDELAQPQVVATPYAAFPGYYTGRFAGPGIDVPWAQMEFAMIGPVLPPVEANVCIYEFMPRATHAFLQQVIDDDMAEPASLRYELLQSQRWIWAAEGRACNAYSPLPNDFSSLDTGLGGWFEQGALSDELVAFVTMARDTASYDPLLYDARNVGQLVRRSRAFGAQWAWIMPDGTTARPSFPAGELLERTDSALLVKWRDIGYTDAGGAQQPVYQWASYRLRPFGLIVHWGPFLDDPAAGAPPVLTDLTPCNGVTTVCYDHVSKPGY